MLAMQLPIDLVITIIGAVVVTLTGWFAFARRMDTSVGTIKTEIAVVKENTTGIHKDIHKLETLAAKHNVELEALRRKTEILTDRQDRINAELEKLRGG